MGYIGVSHGGGVLHLWVYCSTVDCEKEILQQLSCQDTTGLSSTIISSYLT